MATVRWVFAIGARKIDYLDRIPILASRLREPGIRDRCIQQWEAAPRHLHDRLSILLFDEDEPGSLRADVNAIHPDGSNVSDALGHEIDALGDGPMEDNTIEGPHARIKRVFDGARAASWPWVAATARLKQNLADMNQLIPSLGLDLQSEWDRYTSVVRPTSGSKKDLRPVRIQRGVFENHVYRLGWMTMPVVDRGRAGRQRQDGDGGGGGSGDDGPDGGDRPPRAPQGNDAGHGGNGGDDDHGGGSDHGPGNPGGHGPGRGRPGRRPRGNATLKGTPGETELLVEYLAACLQRGMHITVPVHGGAGSVETDEHQLEAFQIVDLIAKPLVVNTYQTRLEQEESASEPPGFKITLQPLTLWAPTSTVVKADAQQLEVFVVDEPYEVDLIDLSGATSGRDGITKFLSWRASASQVENCVCLTCPTLLKPPALLSLKDPGIPTLCVLDALHDKNITGKDTLVVHGARRGRKIYDGRPPLHKKKLYLQCVLALPEILRQGGPEFPSNERVSFYRLLLKRPGEAIVGRPAVEYVQKLKQCSDSADEDAPVAALSAAQARRKSLNATPKRAAEVELAGDSDEERSPTPKKAKSAAAPAPAARIATPGPAPFEVELGGDGGDDDPTPRQPRYQAAPSIWPDGVPHSILSQRVTYEAARESGLVGSSADARIRVTCLNPAHGVCTKSRALSLQTGVFGQRAAEGFLGAWLRLSFEVSAEAHRRPPTREQIEQYLRDS